MAPSWISLPTPISKILTRSTTGCVSAGRSHRVGNSEFYVVCGLDAINEVINYPEVFSSNLTSTMTYTPEHGIVAFQLDRLGGPTQVLATADDPAHAAHRKLLIPQLAAKRIGAAERFVGDTAERLWREGLCDDHVEWMGAMANRLPMMVVARIIGVPDDDVDMLIASGCATTQLLDGLIDADGLAAAGAAAMELSAYVGEHFEQAAANRAITCSVTWPPHAHRVSWTIQRLVS